VCARTVFTVVHWCSRVISGRESSCVYVHVSICVYVCVHICVCVCACVYQVLSNSFQKRDRHSILVGYEYVYIHMYIYITCVHNRLYVYNICIHIYIRE